MELGWDERTRSVGRDEGDADALNAVGELDRELICPSGCGRARIERGATRVCRGNKQRQGENAQRQRDCESMSWVHGLWLPCWSRILVGFVTSPLLRSRLPRGARSLTKSLFNPVVMLRSQAPGNL